MTAELDGKAAIITGGGRGIGRAIAEALIGAGAAVLITGSREYEELERTAEEIGAASLLADVSHDTDSALVLETAMEHFGRIDILANNAARSMIDIGQRFLAQPQPFWHIDPDRWRNLVDTNVNGPFLLARTVVPVMLEQGWGRVINVSISEETMRRRGYSPYGPSKAAVEAMTAIWADELRDTGITVNTLVPGGDVATGMQPDDLPAHMRERLLDPAIVGPAAVYLASRRSDGVNGQRIVATQWNRSSNVDE